MKIELIDSIVIPELTDKDVKDIYSNWRKTIPIHYVPRETDYEIQRAERFASKGINRDSFTLFRYRVELDTEPGLEKLSIREVFRSAGEIKCTTEMHVPLYILRTHPGYLEGYTNRFYVWDDRKFNLLCLNVYWSNETKGYIDRHCGTPYLEFDGTPAGWSLNTSELDTEVPKKGVTILSPINYP